MALPADRVLNVINEGMKTSRAILGDGALGRVWDDTGQISLLLHQYAGWRDFPVPCILSVHKLL